MATTIAVEVMYGTVDADTGRYLRVRVGLDAAPTLDRENVLAVILSDVTTAARSRRTVDGNDVERRGQAFLFNPASGAVLARQGGMVMLEAIGGVERWVWVKENDSATGSRESGLPPVFPKNAVYFHSPAVISDYMKTKAGDEAATDMY